MIWHNQRGHGLAKKLRHVNHAVPEGQAWPAIRVPFLQVAQLFNFVSSCTNISLFCVLLVMANATSAKTTSQNKQQWSAISLFPCEQLLALCLLCAAGRLNLHKSTWKFKTCSGMDSVPRVGGAELKLRTCDVSQGKKKRTPGRKNLLLC